MAGVLLHFVGKSGVDITGDDDGTHGPVVNDDQVGGGQEVSQDADGGTSVGTRRILGVLTHAADNRGHVRSGDSSPQQPADKRQVGKAGDIKRFRVWS